MSTGPNHDNLMALIERQIHRGRIYIGWRIRTKILLWNLTLKGTCALKRTLDMVLSLMAMAVLSPIFAITAIAIFGESPGPIFFAQTRVGLNGRHFRFFKFRSMVVNAEALKAQLAASNESGDGVIFKMKKDPRVTRVGWFIRKFSIDELPQLFNVLKGDMSMVGPRPPVPKEVALYTMEDRKRLHVKPGITCIWQVSGRSNIPFKQQVALDKKYIRCKSLLGDLKILLQTIPAVLSGRGAY